MDSDLANSNASASASALVDVDAPERDQRVYSSLRLSSGHGFADVPPVDDALGFRLPRFRVYHSRVVSIRERSYLIWSPNSLQDPFYPGVYSFPSQLAPAADRSQRRYDGYGGPSDYTRIPQVYQPSRPWLGFIYRENKSLSTDVEYASAYSVWENPTGSAKHGRIRPSHIVALEHASRDIDRNCDSLVPRIQLHRPSLLLQRPVMPSGPAGKQFFRLLRGTNAYEDAVDRLAQVNQWLREKRAWTDMAGQWLDARLPVSVEDTILTADDRLLGVWINGGREEDCLWYLTQAMVPCFVIHALPDGYPVPAQVCESFSDGTDAALFLQRYLYEYDRIAFGQDFRVTSVEVQPRPRLDFLRSLEERRGSSLRWQLRLSEYEPLLADVKRDRGSTDDDVLARRRLVSSSELAGPDSAFEERTRVLESAMATGSRAALPEDSSVSALIQVDASRVKWLRPPAVKALKQKKWTTFRESVMELTDEVYMLELGKHSNDRHLGIGETIWYDRHLQRRLIFEGTPELPSDSGLTTEDEYGRPVPAWPFRYKSNEKFLFRSASLWMYPRESPASGYVGRVASPPEARLLPRLDGGLHDDNAGSWVHRAMSEDAVSLGPDEDPLQVPLVPPETSRVPREVPSPTMRLDSPISPGTSKPPRPSLPSFKRLPTSSALPPSSSSSSPAPRSLSLDVVSSKLSKVTAAPPNSAIPSILCSDVSCSSTLSKPSTSSFRESNPFLRVAPEETGRFACVSRLSKAWEVAIALPSRALRERVSKLAGATVSASAIAVPTLSAPSPPPRAPSPPPTTFSSVPAPSYSSNAMLVDETPVLLQRFGTQSLRHLLGESRDSTPPLLARLRDPEPEPAAPSYPGELYHRFGVALEDRIGDEKPWRPPRKHERARKKLTMTEAQREKEKERSKRRSEKRRARNRELEEAEEDRSFQMALALDAQQHPAPPSLITRLEYNSDDHVYNEDLYGD
ncbi:hypothetical protein B0H12DRAFT_1232300 [Mycena haematopus]|nr:hypothetical protein B0H12DRAFT_1232300 [Mycena haematopus]